MFFARSFAVFAHCSEVFAVTHCALFIAQVSAARVFAPGTIVLTFLLLIFGKVYLISRNRASMVRPRRSENRKPIAPRQRCAPGVPVSPTVYLFGPNLALVSGFAPRCSRMPHPWDPGYLAPMLLGPAPRRSKRYGAQISSSAWRHRADFLTP